MYKQTFSIVAAATLAASLEANELLFDPIVITATKTEQSLKDVTSDIQIITNAELEEKHIMSVAEALNLASGISLTGNGGLGKSSFVYLRGFDSKRTLVLIDGVRYNDPTGLNGAPYEHLMLNDIERIEIVKGAQSGIWGADASAGVINIITKGVQKGVHGSIDGEYGSFNTKKYGVSASYATDKYYFKASSNVTDTDGFTAQAPRGVDIDTLEDDSYKNTTTSLKLGFNLNESNKIDILHTLIDAKNAYDGCDKIWPATCTPIEKADNTHFTSSAKESFTSVKFNHTDSFNILNIYANRSMVQRIEPAYDSRYDGEVREYGLQSQIPYADGDFVVLGADYKSFEHLDELNKHYDNKGVFATNSNKFYGDTVITESVRMDKYDAFTGKTTGKIGIKHDFGNDFYLASNYGTAYNVPTLYNLYSPYGSTDITPESTKSFDASLEYKGLKLTYFYNTIEDMIDFDLSTYTYNNIKGKSILKGWELGYQKELMNDTLISLHYTRLSAKDKDGIDLARREKENLKFGIDYYGIDKFHAGIFGEYIGSRYDDKEKTKQTGCYTLANAVVNYDVTNTVSIYAKIDNITDKYYQTTDGYATSPRAYYAGLKVSF